MSTQTRTLVVMRHATAEQDGPTDAERRLAERGLAEAAEVGRWLAGRDLTPDHALVSAATRTEMTWEAMADAAGWDLEPGLDQGLYTAGPEAALDLVRATGDDVEVLVLVGHNPTVGSLAQLLDDGEGDEQAGTEMTLGFPAAALAVFSCTGSWADLDEASARVVAFHVGRG